MKLLDRYLERLARGSVTQPLSSPVPSNSIAYLESKGYRKLGWRAARRLLIYKLSGQQRYLRQRVEPGWKRTLWLYWGVPQIGDALMDLAPRSLFRQCGIAVDLLTHPAIAELFENDEWFGRVASSPCKMDFTAYDFVIVPSHKSRSLRSKQKWARRLPWISMHGLYTGPEFNRGQFAVRRLADLLGLQLSDEQFDYHASQKLSVRSGPPDSTGPDIRPGEAPIILVIGGVDPRRTYQDWPEVIRLLSGMVDRPLWLVGSDNGRDLAARIMAAGNGLDRMANLVGQTPLPQCRDLLSRAAAVIAADGGLMHLAVAVQTNVVALFTNDIMPQWRLPHGFKGRAIQSTSENVGDIAPCRICDALEGVLKRLRQGPVSAAPGRIPQPGLRAAWEGNR